MVKRRNHIGHEAFDDNQVAEQKKENYFSNTRKHNTSRAWSTHQNTWWLSQYQRRSKPWGRWAEKWQRKRSVDEGRASRKGIGDIDRRHQCLQKINTLESLELSQKRPLTNNLVSSEKRFVRETAYTSGKVSIPDIMWVDMRPLW